MIQKGHLQVYDVTLLTKSPLFIGSGKSYNKKEYSYNPKTRTAAFMNIQKMVEVLIREKLLNKYENFILNRPSDYLFGFLKDCNLTQEEINEMTLYTADAGDALVEGRSLAEIQEFIHDVRCSPYIPGSSLKGAVRTALLMKMIKDNPPNQRLGINEKSKFIEERYFNTLKFNSDKKTDETRSIMRGLSFSDSMPIKRENMILARKDDISVNGNQKSINTIRECVKPGVKISFKMTLDTSVLKDIDINYIKKAIEEYGEYYRKTYGICFKMPRNAIGEDFKSCLVLGGGSGYFGKNIVYPILGKEAGLRYVSKLMSIKFPRHKHENDIAEGISPHRIKHTTYKTKSYHFGICKVNIEQVKN